MQNNQEPTPGLTCPQCRFRMQFTIQELLYSQRFTCPGCGLVLTMNRAESRESLDALQQLHVAMTNVERVRKQSL
jgi:transcription initiation factor IIE alpha subunit